MPNRVYFDNASTTPIHPEVLKAYEEILENYYANSLSLYREGSEVNRMLEKARDAIAGLFDIKSDEIIFTSGSSESNASAIKGVGLAQLDKKHIITTQIEHSSILNACEQMQRLFNYEVTYLPVNEKGVIDIDTFKSALRKDTGLVSIMHVNNEVGSINPIEDIKEIVKKQSSAFFHVDMTQSMGKTPISFKDIDLASISAHKLEGLKGSGLLIKKAHVPFEPLITGGEQENGQRGGTSNFATDLVFAKTLRLALDNESSHREYVQELHDYMLELLNGIEGIEINSPSDGLSCIVNFSYEPIPSEVMQNALNEKGFMVSARSTCESNSNNPSYVLKAMGFSDRRASSCIRICFSYHNTKEEIDMFISSLKEIISHYG